MSGESHNHPPMLGVLVGAARRYWRDVHSGIHRYCYAHEQLSVFSRLSFENTLPPYVPPLDGLIIRADTEDVVAFCHALQRREIPVLNVSGNLGLTRGLPTVLIDDEAIGRLAAEHLLERGFRCGACVTSRHPGTVTRRVEAFIKRMRRDGAKVIPPRPFADRRTWGAFCEWLGSLPAGTGVFTGIDLIASHVMPILHMNGCNVPDEIAVISAGDDEVICETLHPSLSSIKLGGERVGFRAAEIMAGMMRGAPAPAEPVRLPPLHVAERRSTDCLFFDDPVLTQAVRFLRAHACDPIDVSDVLREVPVSRRWLEKHFREELGTTPHREIQRMRLHRAKRLLLRTDLTMEAIRQECGYQTVQHFGAAFKTCTGLPPAAYRASKRVEA